MAGTTALARLLQRRFPNLKVGNALIVMDSLIIITGAILLKSYVALLYSIIYTVFCSKTIDLVYLVDRKVRGRAVG